VLYFVLDTLESQLFKLTMYVERIPNRNSPPAILLRESYRDGNNFKRRTLAM
jgi:hypothetical protein